MKKAEIPVYDICSLSKQPQQREVLAESFGAYLKRHPQSLYNAHRHTFYHMVLFTKGAGTHTIDFTKFKVRPFDIYFMAPGQVHSWKFKGETNGYIVNFSETFFRSFLLNPHYLERFHFFSGTSGNNVCHLPRTIQQKVVQLFSDLLAISDLRDKADPDMMRLVLLQVLMVVENACINDRHTIIPLQKQMVLRNFRRLVDQHFLALRLPKDYAALLYITPNHLNALCQDLQGQTAGDLIRDRILLEAKRLLINVNRTVTEIAFDLNFRDNSYFNRFFKKKVGITPDEFRKQVHKE